ncbi:MAG: lipopolysaccharide biosynthesis protein, partial [Acetobacteraceae bacterium]
IVPAAFWLHDERIIVVSLFMEAAVGVVLSHALAPRERVKSLGPGIRRAALAFGLPLIINGMGLVAIKQLDQVIVANLLGLSSLAVYALAVNLVIAPTSLLQAIQQKLMLPLLGDHRAKASGARLALLHLLGTAILAAGYALPIGLALDPTIRLLYGSNFHVTQVFSALLLLDAFLRFSRGGPNLILLHHGQTGRLTIANLTAGTGVALAFLAGIWTGRLEGIMAGLAVGDFVSFVVLVCLLRQHLCLAIAARHLAIVTCAVAGTTIGLMMLAPASLQQRALIVFAGGCVVLLDAVLVFRSGATRSLSPAAS